MMQFFLTPNGIRKSFFTDVSLLLEEYRKLGLFELSDQVLSISILHNGNEYEYDYTDVGDTEVGDSNG